MRGRQVHVGPGGSQQLHRVVMPPVQQQTAGSDAQQRRIPGYPPQRSDRVADWLTAIELTSGKPLSSTGQPRDHNPLLRTQPVDIHHAPIIAQAF
jgi:hypothetical protein